MFKKNKDPKDSLELSIVFKEFEYPNGYYDFSNGVDCSDEINRFIQEGLKRLMGKVSKGIKNPSFFSATGNLCVCGFAYLQLNGKYTVYVNITRNYLQKEMIDVELNPNI